MAAQLPSRTSSQFRTIALATTPPRTDATTIIQIPRFSGVGSAPEMLPQPTGAIGRLMPPGAGGNLLRSTGSFDGAAAGGHVAVLLAWALGGLGLLFVAGLRARRVAPAPALAPA